SEPREVSLVEAVPRTGRLHQVRRHLKHINHPLIKDANYGRGALNRAFEANYALERLALHSLRLTLRHPATGERMGVVSRVPEDLAGPLESMGLPRASWRELEEAEPEAWGWWEQVPEEHRFL
ncbi:MAG: transaldolase, partial [Myxococcota bacterium]